MQFVETKQAPVAGGHYSQAVIANGFIFVSGLLPLIPDTNRQIPEGIEAQAEQIFKNMKVILQAAQSDLSRLVSVQIFISNVEHWSTVNQVFVRVLGEHKPARTIIPCNVLHYGALIEANAISLSN